MTSTTRNSASASSGSKAASSILNGTVIHLRQPCFYNGPRMQVGDNFCEMGDGNVDTRGDAADSGRNLDDADRKGYLVAQYVLNANKYMMASRGRLVWEQNRQRAFERAAVWMRHYRNHPSVVMWIAGFNFFNSAVDADPRHVGRGGWDLSNERWQRLMVAGKEMFDGLRKLDPTRVYYSHAGAYTGDVYTMNCYLDLIPAPGARRLAERMGRKRRDADFDGRVRHPHGLHVPARTPRV